MSKKSERKNRAKLRKENGIVLDVNETRPCAVCETDVKVGPGGDYNWERHISSRKHKSLEAAKANTPQLTTWFKKAAPSSRSSQDIQLNTGPLTGAEDGANLSDCSKNNLSRAFTHSVCQPNALLARDTAPPRSTCTQTLAIAEILDNVLRFLSDMDDKAPLRACSLVSRLWNPMASRWLFETLWLDPLVLDQPGSSENSDVIRCLALQAYPRICHNVRHLYLRPKLGFSLVEYPTRMRRFAVDLLERILDMFPRVLTLSLSSLPGFEVSPDAALYRAPLSKFYSLKKLDTHAPSEVYDDVFFLHVLPLFAALDELGIFTFSGSAATGPLKKSLALEPVPQRTRLDTITSNWRMTNTLSKVLRRAVDTSHLRHLHLQDYAPSPEGVGYINDVLAEAPFLETINVDPWLVGNRHLHNTTVYNDHVRRGFTFELGFCHHLRLVSLSVAIDDIGSPSAWDSILLSLLTLPSPSLTAFSLKLFFHKTCLNPSMDLNNLLHVLDWAILENVLVLHTNLSRVDIRPCREIFGFLDEARARKTMPLKVADVVQFLEGSQ